MKTATFHVDFIKNHTMKTSLKNALDKIEGVQEVSIDMGNSAVEVGFNDPASEAQIRQCIETAAPM